MRPRSFYIGFPPAVAKVKRRGIEYGIGAIPVGGYVRIPGMLRPAARDLQTLLAAAIEEQPSLALRPLSRCAGRSTPRTTTPREPRIQSLEEAVAGARP